MKTLVKTYRKHTLKYNSLRHCGGRVEMLEVTSMTNIDKAVEMTGESIFRQEDGSYINESGNVVYKAGESFFDFGDYTYELISND